MHAVATICLVNSVCLLENGEPRLRLGQDSKAYRRNTKQWRKMCKDLEWEYQWAMPYKQCYQTCLITLRPVVSNVTLYQGRDGSWNALNKQT